MTKSKLALRRLGVILMYVFLLLSAIFFVTTSYKQRTFKDAQIDEIIFYFQNGLANGQSGSLVEAAQDNFLFVGIVFFLILLPVLDLFRNRVILKINLSFLGHRQRTREFNPSRIKLRFKLSYSIFMLILSSCLLLASFGVPSYLRSLSQSSTIYEENYVDPRQAKLIFPEKKRNLIYIYLESMENTVGSKQAGGQRDQSLIPELEALASDPNNVSFSHTTQPMGGALPAHGTAYTAAGMTAQSSGVPLLVNGLLGRDKNDMGDFNKFLPGSYGLGEVLEKQGYNQVFVMGSDAAFGGRDKLLKQHGNYQLYDFNHARAIGKIPEDYKVWWGYEDKKMFEYAREEATRLAAEDKPFNLQLLTVDTHYVDGWLDETCQKKYENKYDNVHACASKMTADFVEWVKAQPFASDTTVIITGDHLGMQTSYYDDMISDSDYQRTVYSTIINPVISPIKVTNRLFTTMDMYPTTLAAMGVVIPGERLALGTNLFSDQPTLLEHYGNLTSLDDQLSLRSNYYERRIRVRSDS